MVFLHSVAENTEALIRNETTSGYFLKAYVNTVPLLSLVHI